MYVWLIGYLLHRTPKVGKGEALVRSVKLCSKVRTFLVNLWMAFKMYQYIIYGTLYSL